MGMCFLEMALQYQFYCFIKFDIIGCNYRVIYNIDYGYHKFMLSALNRTMNAAISMLVINQPNSTNAKLINISKHIKAKAVLASYTYTKATNVFFSNMYLVANTVYRCAKAQGVYRCATALIKTFHCH